MKIRNERIFCIHFSPNKKNFSNLKFIKHQEKNQVVCRGLLTKNQTTRIGAFLKSCQMRKKSSVSPPNLIGEKRSHDFAAGGSWHAELAPAAAMALESTVIHPHYERTAMQNQVMGHHVSEMCSFPKLVYRSMETSSIRSAARRPSMQIRFAIVYHTHAEKEAGPE